MYFFKKSYEQDKEVDWGEFVEYITKGLIEKDTLEHEQENPVMVRIKYYTFSQCLNC